MSTRPPLQVNAKLVEGDSGSWSCLYRALTDEELRHTTMYAHAAFARVAGEWIANNPIQLGILNGNICLTVATLEYDGDDVLEFEVPLADVIMTAPAWDLEYVAPLVETLRQLADKLDALLPPANSNGG